MMIRKKIIGFTLVELVIVVAIIGILSAIAYPSYQQYVERSKRSKAMGVILNVAQAMERYKGNNFSYQLPDGKDITHIFSNKVPVDGGDAYYNLSITNNTASSYTIVATATGSMVKDGNLSLDHTGAKTWNGKACWPEGSNDCTP